MKSVFVIAEIGVNHNGDIDMAKKMIEIAKQAGANAAKFQTVTSAETIVSKHAPKAEYQRQTTGQKGNQADMLRKILLPFEVFSELKSHCDNCGIEFISTPFDIPSVHMLCDIGQRVIKIPSGEVTNLPYLVEIAKKKKPIIMSTGMCEMTEIGAALDVLKKYGASDITLLHCNTEYPTPFRDANLKAMKALKEFGHPVGYSDHTVGIEAAIAAVALGAVVIEKHFTLGKNMEGPDHKASIEPDELAAMVRAIRNVEKALGDGVKRVTDSERRNIDIARKSIIALRDIKTGEVFAEENITTKRPGNGISPMRWFEVLGTKAKRDFHEDELIDV